MTPQSLLPLLLGRHKRPRKYRELPVVAQPKRSALLLGITICAVVALALVLLLFISAGA
jgi:hypothetical protein